MHSGLQPLQTLKPNVLCLCSLGALCWQTLSLSFKTYLTSMKSVPFTSNRTILNMPTTAILSLELTCASALSHFSHVQLFAIPWIIALQAPLSMGFPRQEYWSGLPCPTPGDLPDPQIEPASPVLAGGFFTTDPLMGQSYLISLIKNTED